MQRVITKLISDSDKMSARIEELTQMKTKIDRIEESLANLGGSIRAVQNGAPASSDPNFSPKVVYDGLAQQIRGMEEKFAQMEKHIEKQTEHIVNSLPPVAGPLKNAVYVLILVQIVICGVINTWLECRWTVLICFRRILHTEGRLRKRGSSYEESNARNTRSE